MTANPEQNLVEKVAIAIWDAGDMEIEVGCTATHSFAKQISRAAIQATLEELHAEAVTLRDRNLQYHVEEFARAHGIER